MKLTRGGKSMTRKYPTAANGSWKDPTKKEEPRSVPKLFGSRSNAVAQVE